MDIEIAFKVATSFTSSTAQSGILRAFIRSDANIMV